MMSVLVIGEILYDVFPSQRRIGGAPFNFAYHLHRLNQPVQLVTRVGEDADGDRLLQMLDDSGWDLNTIQIDRHHPTGTVEVQVSADGTPRFEIATDVAYDHIEMDATVLNALQASPAMIYFGSLIQRSTKGKRNLMDLLSRRMPHTRCFYDMNLRPGTHDQTIVSQSLAESDILKINQDELAFCASIYHTDESDALLVRRMMAENRLDRVALTKGQAGSELFIGDRRYRKAVPETTEVVDTVGAGDAYAAMLALGYLKRWSAQKTIDLCARFAAQICTIQGAVPSDDAFYDDIKQRIKG